MAKVVELPRANTLTVMDSKELMGDKQPPKVNPETGLPEGLMAYVVSTDPKMTVLPHFFSEEECDHLINLVEESWMPSQVGGAKQAANTGPAGKDLTQEDLDNTVAQSRTSWSCMLRYAQTDVIERLEHRLAAVAKLPEGVAQVDRMNMVRYAPGEYFNEHHDGKFRPITIFVYLNDLPEDEEAGNILPHPSGDTFFPVLGYSFKPRRGTAVMWENTVDNCVTEDSRMVHAGRAPAKGVKYGVNCFTNEKSMREIIYGTREVAYDMAAVSKIADLAEASDDGILRSYEVVSEPRILAIPGFLKPEEVEHFLEQANGCSIQPSGPFKAGHQTVRILDFAASPIVEAVECRMVAVANEPLDHLAKLRIVRPGTEQGLCNRGCGKHMVYICLSQQDEVFFPRIGIRFQLSRGDALCWTNVNFDTGFAREDMRTYRMHRSEGGAEPAMGIDGYFHDNPLRAQQKLRKFMSDNEVYGALKPESSANKGGYVESSAPVAPVKA